MSDQHWLLFDDRRHVTGCHCGFTITESDIGGWGDEVVDHLIAVGTLTRTTTHREPAPTPAPPTTEGADA